LAPPLALGFETFAMARRGVRRDMSEDRVAEQLPPEIRGDHSALASHFRAPKLAM
jgi:hypothetical protein